MRRQAGKQEYRYISVQSLDCAFVLVALKGISIVNLSDLTHLRPCIIVKLRRLFLSNHQKSLRRPSQKQALGAYS